MSANIGWTPERDARLLQILSAGRSGASAGAEIGTSRQTALSRARKLGFATPTTRPDLNKRTQAMPTARVANVTPLNIPFMKLDSHHCREVVGTGDDGLAIYCGHSKRKGSSYCRGHSKINENAPSPARLGLWHGDRR